MPLHNNATFLGVFSTYLNSGLKSALHTQPYVSKHIYQQHKSKPESQL